jgi:hypothetical protein
VRSAMSCSRSDISMSVLSKLQHQRCSSHSSCSTNLHMPKPPTAPGSHINVSSFVPADLTLQQTTPRSRPAFEAGVPHANARSRRSSRRSEAPRQALPRGTCSNEAAIQCAFSMRFQVMSPNKHT